GPDRAVGDTAPNAFGAVRVGEASPGDTLNFWVVVFNGTDKCGGSKPITLTADYSLTGDGVSLVTVKQFEVKTLQNAGDYALGEYTYQVGSASPNPIKLRLDVRGVDENHVPFHDGENLIGSPGIEGVRLTAPAFDVIEFTPGTT